MKPQRRSARPQSRSFAVDPPTLAQFLLLSMLLHVLLVVLFGNPTGGPARRGEGWWGPLDVTLRRLAPEIAPGLRLAPGEQTPDSRLLRRSRDATEPRALPREEKPVSVPAKTPEPYRQEQVPEAGETAQPLPVETLRRLVPSAPEEVDKPLTPPTVAPAKIERVAPARIQRALAHPVELPPGAEPTVPAAPLERAAPQRIERELAPPVELPPRAVPMGPTAPLAPTAPPAVERELAPAAQMPAPETPTVRAAPIERVAPAPVERDLASPVELPPHAVPSVPALPLEPVAPAGIERPIAPPVEVPAPRAAPADVPQAPRSGPAPAATPRGPPAETQPADRTAPPIAPTRPQGQPAAPLPPLRFGTPDANDDIFKPRRDGGTPPEAPRIDLDAARKKAAREIASERAGSRGVFTIPSPPPVEKKSKEAMAMEKAIKPDCRTAYAGLGLLAVPVLVANAIAADGSCRW